MLTTSGLDSTCPLQHDDMIRWRKDESALAQNEIKIHSLTGKKVEPEKEMKLFSVTIGKQEDNGTNCEIGQWPASFHT